MTATDREEMGAVTIKSPNLSLQGRLRLSLPMTIYVRPRARTIGSCEFFGYCVRGDRGFAFQCKFFQPRCLPNTSVQRTGVRSQVAYFLRRR